MATVVVVALCGLLLMVGLSASWVTAAVAAHRRAQSAADLAALAAAAEHQRGGDACGRAAALALDNSAELSACAVQGTNVTVSVGVVGPPLFGRVPTLTGTARAGPSSGVRPR